MLDIWDCSSPLRPSVKINAHQAEILSCSWNQFYPFVLATGGAEGLIRIWDIRKLLTPIFQLEVGIHKRCNICRDKMRIRHFGQQSFE